MFFTEEARNEYIYHWKPYLSVMGTSTSVPESEGDDDYREAADAVIAELYRRKGFDGWWDRIDDELQDDITDSVAGSIRESIESPSDN